LQKGKGIKHWQHVKWSVHHGNTRFNWKSIGNGNDGDADVKTLQQNIPKLMVNAPGTDSIISMQPKVKDVKSWKTNIEMNTKKDNE
jgi:hypothetical protein